MRALLNVTEDRSGDPAFTLQYKESNRRHQTSPLVPPYGELDEV